LRLVVASGLAHGRTIDVEDEVVLGREETLDGALQADHSISRRHARIHRTGDGSYVVEDEHSRNGTFVNGERIDVPHVLQPGDEVRIGSTVFSAILPEPRALPPPIAVGASGTPLSLRLVVDPEQGEVVVAIDEGPSIRIVRLGGTWQIEAP
jgi:3',5'-cyclic-nucleotide phosphodiesterase